MGDSQETQGPVKMEFAPPARSCHVTKWPEFQGYGFTLHHNKKLDVQEIGKVDEGSPAAAAGLRAHDIIVEINGTNVSLENHKQIVDRIKSSGDSVTILVVDEQRKHLFSPGFQHDERNICCCVPCV